MTAETIYHCCMCGYDVPKVDNGEVRNDRNPANSLCPECAMELRDMGVSPRTFVNDPDKFGF